LAESVLELPMMIETEVAAFVIDEDDSGAVTSKHPSLVASELDR
jgi:hypothetical protein